MFYINFIDKTAGCTFYLIKNLRNAKKKKWLNTRLQLRGAQIEKTRGKLVFLHAVVK